MSDLSVGQRQGPGVFINYSPANAETRITGQQYTQQELYDIWNGWVKNAPPGNGEYRELAFGRLVDWLKEPSSNLDLRNLNLSSIPFIPPVPRCECLIIDMNTFRKLSHNEVEKESLQKSAENVLICTPPPDSENIRTFEVDLNDEKKSKSQIQYVKSLLIDPFTKEDLTRIYTKITGNTELEHFESWAKKETKGGELSGPEKKKLNDRWQEKHKEQKNRVAQFYTECGNTKEHIIPQCLISKSTAQPGMILGNKAKRVSKDLNGVLRARGMIFFADNESHKRHVGTKWLIEAKEKVQIEKLTALKEKKNEEIIHDERANLSFFKEDGNYVYFKKSQNPIISEEKNATILVSIAPKGVTHDEILKHETERMDYLSIVSYLLKNEGDIVGAVQPCFTGYAAREIEEENNSKQYARELEEYTFVEYIKKQNYFVYSEGVYHNGDAEKTKEVLQVVELTPSDKLAMLTVFLTAKSGHNISISELKEFFQKHQLHLGPEATVFNEPVIQGDEKMKVINNLTK